MTIFIARNLRYFRAKFVLRTFSHLLRTFLHLLRNVRKNRFCAVWRGLAQNRKYYAKRNFLSKLSKIAILSKELTTKDLFTIT